MFFERFFIDLIRLLLTLTLLGAVGTLILTQQMSSDPHAAVTAYHSVGLMAEHVLAGCVCCLTGLILEAKFRSFLYDGSQN